MKRWSAAAEWKQYKSAYAKSGQAKKLAELGPLFDDQGLWGDRLRKVFVGQEALIQDLEQLLQERLSLREEVLQSSRGRQARPDYPDQLSQALKRLRLGYGALKGLRALEGKEPWVEKTLLPDVQYSREVVANLLLGLERNAASDPRAPALGKQARELLREVVLSPGPAPGQ